MTELEGKKEETEAAKKIIHTYPLIRVSHGDMTLVHISDIHFASAEHWSDLCQNSLTM